MVIGYFSEIIGKIPFLFIKIDLWKKKLSCVILQSGMEDNGVVGKQGKITKVVSTSVFKLIVIVIVVIIPLNILILTFSKMIIEEAGNQISIENENILKLYINQMDGAMERGKSKIQTIALDNTDFARLNNKQIMNQTEYYQQIQTSVNLMGEYGEILTDHELITGVFSYFPDKNIRILNDRQQSYGTLVMNFIKEIIQDDSYITYLNSWSGMKIDGHPVIIYIARYKNAYYGAWIDIDDFMKKMSIENLKRSKWAFVNKSDNVIYNSSTELEVQTIENLYKNQENKEYLVLEASSEYSDVSIVQFTAKSDVMQQLPGIISFLQFLSICTLLAVPVVIVALRKWMVIPLGKLSEAMNNIEQGRIDFRIAEENTGSEYTQINRHFNKMMDEVAELNRKVLEERLKKQDIQMRFLSQQIRPHFILNAMNIIYSYEPEEYPLIQKMILCLSKYFRYVVNANKDFVELSMEMEHIANYLDIQHERYPNIFYSHVEYAPETAKCLIPPLLIQSFAENSIKHSLNMDLKIHITIIGEIADDGRLRICLEDTGKGISKEILEKIEKFKRTGIYQEGLGVGIQNTIERLKLKYGNESEMIISVMQPHGTRVEIYLPAVRA